MFELVKQRVSAGLVAGVFNSVGNLTIYSDEIEGDGSRLSNVLISDDRDLDKPKAFFAKHGEIVSDNQKRTLTLKLFDGSIHEGTRGNYDVTYFEVNDIVIDHEEIINNDESSKGRKAKEMSVAQLRSEKLALSIKSPYEITKDELRKYRRYGVELQRRLTIPFSCICVALLAMALGVQTARGSTSWGMATSMGMGISTIVFYYILTAFASSLGRNGLEPVEIVMWAPNALILLLAIYLFRALDSERWQEVGQIFSNISRFFTRLVKSRSRIQPLKDGGK